MRPRPYVIVHSSVSVDSAVTGFMPDLGVHYAAAGVLDCDAHLVGSVTMRTGLAMADEAPGKPSPQVDGPPEGRDDAPWWFVVDSQGVLQDGLGALRTFPGLRDVVLLVSGSTPQDYLDHLAQGRYPYIVSGDDHVDLGAALSQMAAEYGVRRVLVDSGPTLTSLLLDRGLVDEISLVVHPLVMGAAGRRLFGEAHRTVELERVSDEELPGGARHLRFRVTGPARA